MRLIEGIVDGIICFVAIVFVLFFIFFSVRIFTVIYHSNDIPQYPQDTPAPRLEIRYEKENAYYYDNDNNDDPFYWSYAKANRNTNSTD